jgi:hypothetical protein
MEVDMAKRIAIYWIFVAVLCVNCVKQEKNTVAVSSANDSKEQAVKIAVDESKLGDTTPNVGTRQAVKVAVEPVDWEGLVETASMPVVPEFPRLESEPENVDRQSLGGLDAGIQDIDLDLVAKIDVFLEQFSREASDENEARFLGTWILHDENDMPLGDYDKMFDTNTTDIQMFEKNGIKILSWRRQLNGADLYFADGGTIYMLPAAPGGMLGFFS